MALPKSKVSLKLLIDRNSERVLFAEASKEFVDFLFNLYRLPLGKVTSLLTGNSMVGCLGTVYKSIENLSDGYLLNPTKARDILLKPSVPVSGCLFPTSDDQNVNANSGTPNLYMCARRCTYAVTNDVNTTCPNINCRQYMRSAVTFVGKNKNSTEGQSSSVGERGFVKGMVTYMVMDDLEVCPMSPILINTIMSKFNVKDTTSVQEKVVELGIKEGIQLLKASLQSKKALTSVFLKNISK